MNLDSFFIHEIVNVSRGTFIKAYNIYTINYYFKIKLTQFFSKYCI